MSLKLGKTLDRNYNLRIHFLDSFYDVGVFFNKKSSFVLFNIKSDLSNTNNAKIKMFKNLESSQFCDIFINLHNYTNSNLDIRNQFKNIKEEYNNEINYLFNETINLTKVEVNDKTIFDFLTIYGLTINDISNEFIFIIAERAYINRNLNKKVVRTTAMQIATTNSLNILNDYSNELKNHTKIIKPINKSNEVIKFD